MEKLNLTFQHGEIIQAAPFNLMTTAINDLIDNKVDAIEGSSLVSKEKIESYDSHLKNLENPHKITKEQVGLGNCDNTADADKPVSTATQKELDKKQNVIEDLADIKAGATAGSTAVQPEKGKGLFSGDYNDLTNKPDERIAALEQEVSDLKNSIVELRNIIEGYHTVINSNDGNLVLDNTLTGTVTEDNGNLNIPELEVTDSTNGNLIIK